MNRQKDIMVELRRAKEEKEKELETINKAIEILDKDANWQLIINVQSII